MIKKINSNKNGVIEYSIDSVEDLDKLPRKETDNTVYAILNKDNKRLVYLYSKAEKDYILINGDLEEINEQLDKKANLNEVFIKEQGININDFDEDTRRTFLEAQGIDVNYVLGEGNVKPINTSFMVRKNLYDNETINDLGINDSGTTYPLTGGYASKYITIGDNTKLYSKLIGKIAFFKEDGTFIKVVNKSKIFTEVAMPDGAFKIRYSISKSDIANAFITLTNEELFIEEMGYKLPFSRLSDNEFRAKMKEFRNVIEITTDNCDFFNVAKNLYDNTTINNLGINNSGTKYPLTGAYASKDIEIGSNKYVYPFKITRIVFKDESDAIVKTIQNALDFRKIEVPLNAVKFMYSVGSANISSASIYLTDFELSSNPPIPTIKNEHINIEGIKNNINSKSFNTTIACYGDSLTEGAGSTNAGVYSYPSQLQNIINEKNEYTVTVLNRGIGGNTSLPIAYKSGCYADMVNPFTIPSDTTPVEITKTGYLANKVNGTPSIRNGVNPVTINGIEGKLSYSDSTYKFTRLTPGEVVEVNRPTQILPYSSQTDKGAILIIGMGTNDSDKEELDYPPKLIQRMRRMIDYLQCKQYIILGLTTRNRQNVNKALEEEFGANYFDVFNYIIKYGLQDNNLTPTDDDLEDISNGVLPRQLMNDQIHYNNHGYYSKAMGIYLKGKDLGYWL